MDVPMADLLPDHHSIVVFLLVSVAMGGGCAWLAGRAVAATWRPWWQVALYMTMLGAVVRFIHFALFESPLLSWSGYAGDLAVCLAFGLVGFRLTRVAQMTSRYGWLNERAGPLRWRRRDHTPAPEAPESG
jgi:hypothetical protein